MKKPRVSSGPVGERTRRAVFFSAVLLGLLFFLIAIKAALFPILFSFFLAYLFCPVTDFFESRRVPRTLIVLLLILIAGGLVALAILFLIPALQKEAQKLADNFPQFIQNLQKNVVPFIENRLNWKVPLTVQEAVDEMTQGASGLIGGEIVRPLAAILTRAFSGFLSLLTVVLAFVLIPFLMFFFLRDYHLIMDRIVSLFPRDVRTWLVERFDEVDEVLGGFIRGQLIICLILAVLYSVGLSVIGVDLSVLIGTIGGLGFIVPYLGAAVAIGLSALMSLATFGPDVHILYIIGWFFFVHIWEAYLITPTIVGHRVGMSPLAVILSLYIGGETLGLLGLLLAVPVVAVLKVFVRAGLDSYYRSPYFLGR